MEIDTKVVGREGTAVRATALHHSGSHPVVRVEAGDRSVTATANHPLLCLARVHSVPTVLWKLVGEIAPGDVVLLQLGDRANGEMPLDLPDGTAYYADKARRVPGDGDPHAFHFAKVTAVVDAGVQPVYSLRVDSADHAFITNGFVSHNTESRLSPLAMEMLREIDQETVDFRPNYDGRTTEPDILPSRIPNLLVNGSSGIAVGMATNIPPHNLREVADGVAWTLANPEATDEELLEALMERIKGPDFPTHGLIVGRDGIEDAYRTGRGSIRMRAVVTVEEDTKGRTILVVTELPYQVNPDNLAESIATAGQGRQDRRDQRHQRRVVRPDRSPAGDHAEA